MSGDTFWRSLHRPEYLHVLLNPLPVYGLAVALLAVIVALVARQRTALVVGLSLVVLSSLSAWPAYVYGEAAYDRVKATTDTAGEQWLDEHMARAEKFIVAFYSLAGLAFAAIVVPLKWPRTSVPLALATVIIGIGTLGIGSWIAYAGGRVRHKEFRFAPPPETRKPTTLVVPPTGTFAILGGSDVLVLIDPARQWADHISHPQFSNSHSSSAPGNESLQGRLSESAEQRVKTPGDYFEGPRPLL
jgi:hypothetical protein